MSDKETWRETGAGIGHAFRDLGKTIINSGKKGVDHATDWAARDNATAAQSPYDPKTPQQAGEQQPSPYAPPQMPSPEALNGQQPYTPQGDAASYTPQPPAQQPAVQPAYVPPAPAQQGAYVPPTPPVQQPAPVQQAPAPQPVNGQKQGWLSNKGQVLTVPHSVDVTYAALKSAVSKIGGFAITGADDAEHSLQVNAGVSAFSWGERITVHVMPNANGGTAVEVLSAPKVGAMGNAADMGKNNRNIAAIFNALQRELPAVPQQTAPQQAAPQQPAFDASLLIADELKKLAELRDQGILTDEEFAARKQKLLG